MRSKIRKRIAVMLSLACMASAVYVPELTLTAAAEEEAAVVEEADAAAAEDAEAAEEAVPAGEAIPAGETLPAGEAVPAGEEQQVTLPDADPAAEAGDDVAAEEAVDAETPSVDLFDELPGDDYEDEELFDQFDEFLEEESEEVLPEEEPLSEDETESEYFEESTECEELSAAVYTGTDDNSCKWSYDTTTHVLTVESNDSDAKTLHSLTGSNIDTVKANASRLVLKKIDTVMPSVFKGYKFSTIEFCPELRWIRDNAFESLLSLNGIDLSGTTLFWIEPSAFKGCTNLKSAVFPDTLRQINKSAFEGCTALREVDLSNTGVYIIDDSAFKECTFLGKMLFPDTLETLGDYAIYKCGSISDSNTEIASRLKELDLRMVKKFGDHAVSENRWLTTISISKKINEIGGSVTSTTFVGNGRAISSANGYWTTYFYGPEDVFNSIPYLMDNPFPKAVICIDPQMMGEAGDCTWKLSYDKKTLTVTPKGGIAAPKLTRILTANVGTDIDDYKKVEKVVIQSGVKILDNALPGFTGVKTVELPDGLTTIGTSSFSGCTGLANIIIPATVTSLGEGAFRNCTALAKIEIPSNVTSLGASAFQGCSALTDITFKTPSKVGGITSIGEYTFYDCRSLTSIEIPNSVESIGIRAFSCCSSLTRIEIPNSVTSIGDYAFESCSSLTSITIPDGVTVIGASVFYGCDKLTISFIHVWNDKLTVDKQATCTKAGVKSIHCTVCDAIKDGSEIEIPATGHTPVTDAAVAATTTSTGLTEGSHCSVCGEVLTAQKTIPMIKTITVTKKPTIKKPAAKETSITVNWKHFKHTSRKTKKIWKKIKKVEVQCATDKAFKNIVKTKMVKKSKTKAVIKGLKKKTTYYVRVRYYDGTGYSEWSKTKKIKTQSVQSYYDNSWKKEAQKMSKEKGAWKTVHVDSNYLALRRSPIYDSSNEIGRLYNGDTVQITGNCSKSYVSVYSPKYNANGWVNAGFLR